MNKQTIPTDCHQDLYHPIEHAILADYLQIERPACAGGIVLADEVEETTDTCGNAQSIIRIRTDFRGEVSDLSLQNAVARLILNGIEQRLPQWGIADSNGSLFLARKRSKPREGLLALLPQFLLEINWATSGPGFSWPERYYVAHVPGYGHYVVTASHESADSYGYEHLAIGHFHENTDLLTGCRQVLVAWWCRHGEDPIDHWESVWSEGLIDEIQAWDWSEEVWK